MIMPTMETNMSPGGGPSVLVIMHDRLAPAGLLGERIYARGGRYRSIMPHEGYDSNAPHERRGLPEEALAFDGLVVLGGAMSATDDAAHPHYSPLLALIRDFHAAHRPVLGICLGAQLLARAFGARVFAQGWFDLGFAPVTLTEAGARDPLLKGLAPTTWLMEAHEDAFELPPGAVALATGDTCHNQIFCLGETTYGFQCHIEVNADIARSWIRARREVIAAEDPALFSRFEAQLTEHLPRAMAFGSAVFDRWIDLVQACRHVRAR